MPSIIGGKDSNLKEYDQQELLRKVSDTDLLSIYTHMHIPPYTKIQLAIKSKAS